MVETKNKSIWWFELVIRGYLTQQRVFFDSTTFRGQVGQKNVKKFVGFLEYGRTWYFAFDNYWHLHIAWP